MHHLLKKDTVLHSPVIVFNIPSGTFYEAVFACILSPNLLFPILKTTADEGTGENRSLAAFPTLSLETIDTFPSGVEDWINDHAAFRNRFLSLNARLNLSLFQFGDSQDVITGKDGCSGPGAAAE